MNIDNAKELEIIVDLASFLVKTISTTGSDFGWKRLGLNYKKYLSMLSGVMLS